MGRHRSRSYSPRRYSRSPPRQKRYDDPRDRYSGGGGGDNRGYRDRRIGASSGLLIRNISLGARPEDLRIPFERFGPVKDVYLPKNYHTGEPRGFGFVKFRYAEDASVAKQEMNHQIIGGREISIVFAEENRKSPKEMRMTSRISDRFSGGSNRRRSPPRSTRHHRSFSRSPSPTDYDTRDRYYSPRRSISRSPHNDRDYRPRHRSPQGDRDHRSHHQSPSPGVNGRNPPRSRSYSPR